MRKRTSFKLLITGIHSRMGSRVRELAIKRGWRVRGLDLVSHAPDTIVADISRLGDLRRVFKREMPDGVIHTAAYTDVDGCESKKRLAWKVNVTGTANTAECALGVKARMLHISTDYVFDGKKGPYAESDKVNPISYYGVTKLEAEKAVRSVDRSAVIVRTCVPYDWNNSAAPNFLMWLVQQLKAGKPVKIVTDQWNTPTFVPDFARSLLELVLSVERGVLNVSGGEFINRFDFAVKACKVFGCDEGLVHPCLSSDFKQAAARPMRAGLIVKKAEAVFGQKMLSADEGLEKTVRLYAGN